MASYFYDTRIWPAISMVIGYGQLFLWYSDMASYFYGTRIWPAISMLPDISHTRVMGLVTIPPNKLVNVCWLVSLFTSAICTWLLQQRTALDAVLIASANWLDVDEMGQLFHIL